MNRNLAHKLILLLIVVALAVALFACSPRGDENFPDNEVLDGEENQIQEKIIKEERAKTDVLKKETTEALSNYKTLYESPEDPEWFIIDLTLTYAFEHFWLDSEEKYEKSSAFTIEMKGNVHLKDNNKSELYFQVRNANNLAVMAVYYASGYTYVVVGTQKYYMPELNFTEVGGALFGVLQSAGVDVNQLFAAIMAGGKTGIAALDDMGIIGLVGTILFNPNGYITSYNQREDEVFENRDLQYSIKLNNIISMLSGAGLSIPGVITISFDSIWDMVGLNLDPVLLQFLGFNLERIGAKQWPDMDARLSARTELETITKVDEDGLTVSDEAYVMKGIGIDIVTDNDVAQTREKYANTYPSNMAEGELIEEFEVNIGLTPLLYGSNEKIQINFGGLGLNEQGRKDTYAEGGIGNLGLGATLYFENDENGSLTINRVLGEAFDLNLGALGDMPINLPYAARYELGLDVKLALDFFDGAKTQAEITISFNDSPLMRLFLTETNLYINFEDLETYSGQLLPNVVLQGFDINSLLGGVLGGITPYLDPNYVKPVVPDEEASNALFAGLFNEGEEGAEGGGGIDIMAILKVVLNNLELPGIEEYLYNEDGTVKTDAYGKPIPNDWNIALDLNSEDLSQIVGMITPIGGNLGEELNVKLSFNQKNVLDTIGLVVDISDTFRLGLDVDYLTYMREPDWENYAMVDTAEERAKYTNLSVYKTDNGDFIAANRNYNVILQGDVTLGASETTDKGLDLSSLIGTFVDNLLLSIGVEYDGSTTIAYTVQGNIDILDMAQTELKITIFNRANNDPFIRVIYSGIEDTLYIDLEPLKNMGFASLGKLPRLKYENMGLRDTLAGLDIASVIAGLLVNEDTDVQNALTIDTSNPDFLNQAKLGLYQGLVINEYLATGVLLGNEALGAELFNLNDGEETTEGEGEATEEGGGLDIMALIGMALSEVELDRVKGTLTVVVAANVLSSLLTMLLAPVDEFGNPETITMPNVNAFVQIKAIDFDFGKDENGNSTIFPENGYLRIYLSLLDDGDQTIEAISLEIDILKDIALRAGKENLYKDIEEDDYIQSFVSIPEFLDELTVGLRLEGHFDLTVDETPVIDEEGNYVYDEEGNQVMQGVQEYTNAYLNQMLSGLIEGLGLIVDTSKIDIELGFEIVAKLSLGGIIKLDGSEAADPIPTILGGSELAIRLYDRKVSGDAADILGIYLLDGNLYLDLSFFDMPNIGINDVASLIDDLGTLTGSAEADQDEAPANLLNLNRVEEFADASNPEAVALQVILDYDKVAINLTKDAIAGLLGLFLSSDLPIEIQETSLELGLGDKGAYLEVATGVEIFNLSLGLSRLQIALDGEELSGADFLIDLPEGEEFFLSDSGLPTNVYLEIGGYANIHSEVVEGSDRNTIDLSPALSGLLGDIELSMLIEFLGLVDESLFFDINANLNLEEIIGIINNGFDFANLQQTGAAIILSTYASADPSDENYYDENGARARRPVMEIYYVEGDVYAHIDTFIANLEYIHIPRANELIAGLLGSLASNAGVEIGYANNEGAEVNPTEVDAVKYYINLALADYGLSVTIAKSFVVGVLNMLGLNIEEYLKSIDISVEVGLNASPLEVELALNLRDVGMDGEDQEGTATPNDSNFVTLGASINKLVILMDKMVELSEEEKAKYDEIDSLDTIGVSLGGVAKFEITSPEGVVDPDTGAEGNLTVLTNILEELKVILGENAEKQMLQWIREASLKPEYAGLNDDELKAIYHEEVRSNIDYQALLNFALIVEVVGNVANGTATFGGELYYDIEVILDISNIANLKASIFFSTSPKLENRGDIMWVSLMGVEDPVTGEIDLNVFADLTKVFGSVLEIKDVIRINNFNAFTDYMENFAEVMTNKKETIDPVALNSTNNGLVLPRNADGKVAPSIMTATSIILAITADPDTFGIPNGAPVAIVAPSAAIYSLASSLLMTDQEFQIAIDESKISTYANSGVYSAQEYYYAIHGLVDNYRVALKARYDGGILSIEDYNTVDSAWVSLLDSLTMDMSIEAMDSLFSAFLAQYKEMIGEKHAQFFPNITQEGVDVLNADLTPVETLYATISTLDGVYSEEQYNNLKAGLTAIRKAELDDMLANGELTQANYEYLYYGLLRTMEGESVDPSEYGAIDLSKFFGIHDPSLLIELGAAKVPDEYEESGYRSAFLLANISLAELLEVQLEIGSINVTVSPDDVYYTGTVDEYGTMQGGLLNPNNDYYWFNPNEMAEQNINISISGKTKLRAEDTTPETAIDFKELLEAFFTEVDFGAIIENSGLEDKELLVELSLNLNMHDLMKVVATGDINWLLVRAELMLRVGVEVEREYIDVEQTALKGYTVKYTEKIIDYITLYYADGTAYIDGRMLGVQRIKVEMFLDHIFRLLGNEGLKDYFDQEEEDDDEIYEGDTSVQNAPSTSELRAEGKMSDEEYLAKYSLNEGFEAEELLPYVRLVFGNGTGFIIDVMGSVLFAILGGLDLGIDGIDDLGGLVADIVNDNFALQLGLIANLAYMNDFWTNDPDENGVVAEDENALLGLTLELANYTVGMAIMGLDVDFIDSSEESPSLAPVGFDDEHYAEATDLSEVYVELYVDFDIDGDQNTKFNLDETVAGALGLLGSGGIMDTIGGLGLAPIIQLLSTVSTHYRLEIIGNINFDEILELNTLYKTNFAITLRDRNKTINYEGEEKFKEVLSVYYVDTAIYINAECFNIQAVKIDNAWNFLTQEILPAFGVPHVAGGKDPEGESTENGTEEVKNLGFAGYESVNGVNPYSLFNLPQGATAIPGYINLLFSPDGFIISITTTALFGILRAIGGESMDFSSYVEPIGELEIELGIAGPNDLLAIDITFQGYEFSGDERVDLSTDPNVHEYKKGGKIGLGLSVSNSFVAALSYQWMEDIYYSDGRIESYYVDHKIEAPKYAYLDGETLDEDGNVVQEYVAQEYVEFDQSDPVVSLELNLYLELGSEAISGDGIKGILSEKIYSGYDLNKEPITSLLATLLAGLLDETLSILLEVVGDHQMTIEVEILVNLPLLNYRGVEAQITIKRIDGNHDYKILQVNLHNSFLYIDLTYLNGPKFSIADVLETILGEKDLDLWGEGEGEKTEGTEGEGTEGGDASVEGGVQNANGVQNAVGGGAYTPIYIDLATQMVIRSVTTHGLALYVTETAVNSILGMFEFANLKVFSDVLLQISIAPKANTFNFGIDLELSATSTVEEVSDTAKVLDLGLAIGDHRVNFERYPSDKLLLPQTANYLPAHNVNTIELEAGFEIRFKVNDGVVDLGNLYKTILDENGPLGGMAANTAFETLFSKDSPLATALPNLIMLGFLNDDDDSFGDVIRFDIEAKAFIKGGLQGLLDNLQLKLAIYSLKNQERFKIVITYYNGDLYLDLSTLGLGKIEIWELGGMIDYLLGGGNTEEEPDGEVTNPDGENEEQNEITPEVEALFAATYPTWGQVLGLNNESEEEQLVGIVKVLLSQDDGLLLTVTFEMINVILGLVGLDVSLEDYLKGVIEPSAGVGMTPNSEYHVDINLDTGKDYRDVWEYDEATGEYKIVKEKQEDNSNAGINLGIAILGENIKADIKNETKIHTPFGIQSTLEPVISQDEISSYTKYDEMAIQLGTNVSLQLDFEDGDVSLVDLLDLVFGMLNIKLPEGLDTSIVLAGGDETLFMEINLKVALDLKRMLSTDPEVFNSALILDLVIRYTIIDNTTGEIHDTQKVLQLYMVDNVAYIGIELFDTNLDIKLDEFDITRVIRDFMEGIFDMDEVDQGIGGGATGGGSSNVQNAPSTAPDGPARNPIIDMYEKSDYAIGNFLKPIIYLNSEGFGLMITKELLVGAADALVDILTGLLGSADSEVEVTEDTINGIASLLLDHASLGLFFEEGTGGVSFEINITKNSAEIETEDGNKYMSAGYAATLSLLHDSTALISTESFNEYLDFMRNDEEQAAFYDGCFSTSDVEWRVNLGVDITVGADIREYILNWSSLFQNEADENGNVVGAAFYIQALNDIIGDATLRIKADVKLTALDKWGIDAIIQLVKLKEDGTYAEGESDVEEEYFALYVVGSLNQSESDYNENGLGLYLNMAGFENLGITGITLNSAVFEKFLNLNLKAVLDSLGGTLGNMTGGIVQTLDDLIESLYDMLADEDVVDNAGENAGANANVQNAGEDDENIYDYEEEVKEENSMWFIGLLDSIQFTKGAISIVVAQTAIQTILDQLFGFPFDEKIGNLSVVLDNTGNSLSLNLGLDYQEPIDATDTEIADISTTIATSESVDMVMNTMGGVSAYLTAAEATFEGISYSVYASQGFIGTSLDSESYGITAVGEGVTVEYLVYETYDIFSLEKGVEYPAEEINNRANAVKDALIESLTTLGGYGVAYNDATGVYLLTNDTAYTRVSIKVSEGDVLLATAVGTAQAPALNIAGINVSSLGEKLVSVVSERVALEKIRETYESSFLIGATVPTDNGDIALSAESTYLRQQVISEDKDFALEDSGTRNVFYFIYDASKYFPIDPALNPGSAEYLQASKEGAQKVSDAISEFLQLKTYVWSENADGVVSLYHYGTMLNASLKVAPVVDVATGAIECYKVLMVVSSSKSMYNVSLSIHSLDIGLGENTNIFHETALDGMMRDDFQAYFAENFRPLSDYKMEMEVNLELNIDDTVGGLFDMSELLGTVGGLIGGDIAGLISQINLALQPIDDIAIAFGLTLRLFIDFSDITPMRLQLEMTYNDKTMVLITYEGKYEQDENGIYENSTAYVDLSGLGFPSVKLEGIQLGAVLKNLVGGLGGSNASGDTSVNDGTQAVNAQNANDNAVGTVDKIEDQHIDRVYLKDYGWTERLLLLTFGADETSLAITGALVYSLLANASKNDTIAGLLGGAELMLPMFRNLQIGYSNEDGVYGLCLRLTDDTPYEKAFRIGFNGRQGKFEMWTDENKGSSISAREHVEGSVEEGIVYEDIGIISKVALNLELEARVRTRDTEKAPQLLAMQELLENLLGMSGDTINFDVQNTVLVFTLGLTVYADLADMTNTTLALSIGLTGEEIIGVYFLGKTNTAYVNLSGLGLFQAALNGVDVLGILNSFLGSFLGDEGINLNEMLSGVLTVEEQENAAVNANNALSTASAQDGAISLNDKAQNGIMDLVTATDAPLLKILMSNEELIINPNMAIVQTLMGDSMVLPNLTDIRLSINLYQGLNNLNLRVKLDQKGNYLNLAVHEGNFGIALGSTAQFYQLTTIGDESQYGGIEGLTLGMDSAGNLAANISVLTLAQGILDVIQMSDFTIYIEKRNDYFFLRNLGYGMSKGVFFDFAIGFGVSLTTGPTYFSPVVRAYADENGLTPYDHAFVSKGAAFNWEIAGFNVGSLLKTYEPIFFDNAYRRIRLALNKTVTNKVEIPINQLTQVANVQGSLSNEEDWEPQSVTAFIRNNVLHLSLASILVLDISGLINTVAGWLLETIVGAINGIAGTVVGLVWDVAGPAVSTWIADMIGDATGYGSP
ncbi:MAG: hypothetical protein IJ033_02430, partial [Clostridia bacterium]|nr:hypothetical protein [Clostridia bacterium]